MKKIDYGEVRILLAIENPMVSKGLQNVLHHEGFPRPLEADSQSIFLQSVAEQSFDVIVTATELGADFMPPTIQKLRQGRLKHHPLPIIIALLVSSEGDYIRKAINSGPDDLLQLPVVPGQLLARLAVAAEQPRKPFIVTSDYVGPDRRTANRPDTFSMPLLEVPNLVALKVKRTSNEVLAEEIRAASDKLRQMRLERFAFELQWLLRAIRQLFQSEQQDAEKLQTFCERIKTLLSNLPRLLPELIVPVLAPQTERLTLGANILLKSGFSADATVLQGLGGLINKVTDAIMTSISPEILLLTGRVKTPESE